ncbi:hypothetical protein HGRIS_002160 [Hohenbuehelia grisea]
MNFEIFVHKAEKLQEDDKIENFRQLHERVADQLLEKCTDHERIGLNFYLTSVYDHSVNEAFSRVLQGLIGSLSYLEDLLNGFCANSQTSKVFLFDIKSRLFIATDASPVDAATHNLCCDYLSMLKAFGPLYQSKSVGSIRARGSTSGAPTSAIPQPSLAPSPSSRRPPLGHSSTSTSSVPPSTNATERPSKEFFYPSASTTLSSTPLAASQSHAASRTAAHKTANNHSTQSSGTQGSRAPSSAISNSTALTYHVLTPHLALVALVPIGVHEGRRALLEWNVVWVREGVKEIWEAEWKRRRDAYAKLNLSV